MRAHDEANPTIARPHENPMAESMPSIDSMGIDHLSVPGPRRIVPPSQQAPGGPLTARTRKETGMSEYNQTKLTQDIVDAFAGTPDPRLRELMTALVKHILAFAREVDLTPDEWMAGLKFLNATGQISTEKRPEFILLSDTLGLSMMVVALAQARASGASQGATEATEATVEGPFYWPGAPDLPLGSDIGEGVPGEPTLYMGRVTDCDGKPLGGALLDVWSGDGDGKYDVQLAPEPTMKARGRFRTDPEGRYWFWSIHPEYYPVPDDGTVGEMLRATNRSINRPGHIHMMVSADAHVPLTTHIFVAGSPFLDEDAVFGKRDSLVVDFDRHPPGKAVDGREMRKPYYSASFDFRLAPTPA
jgi:hydroxyquinol 1,2-dioxygenase